MFAPINGSLEFASNIFPEIIEPLQSIKFKLKKISKIIFLIIKLNFL